MDSLYFFFFSSRRRHTRWNCDWSSDVCSSDLTRRQQCNRRWLSDLSPQFCRHVTGRVGRRATRLERSERPRSEEHTSELQSQFHLVCRLLLEQEKVPFTNPHLFKIPAITIKML